MEDKKNSGYLTPIIGCLAVIACMLIPAAIAAMAFGYPLTTKADETTDIELTCVYVSSVMRGNVVEVSFNSELGNRYTTTTRPGIYAEGDTVIAYPIYATHNRISDNLIIEQDYILEFEHDIYA